MTDRWRARLRAGGWHFLCSAIVASVVAVLVFGLWYPGAYVHLAGGTGLLLTIVAVDVVVGPLLTFLIYDIRKPRNYLTFDIVFIAMVQTAALAYGMYSVFLARPVALVFEGDRFRVITAAEVVMEELPMAPDGLTSLPLTGPRLLAVRKSSSPDEFMANLKIALNDGVDTSQRPGYWERYGDTQRKQAVSGAAPLVKLTDHYGKQADEIRAAVESAGMNLTDARFLPVRAKNDSVAVINSVGEPTLFLPYDPFVLK